MTSSVAGYLLLQIPPVGKICDLTAFGLRKAPSRQITEIDLEHTLPETNSKSTWKWMVGILYFPIGEAYFQGLC